MAKKSCAPLTIGQKHRMKALLEMSADFGKNESVQQLGEYGDVLWQNIKRKVIGDNLPSDGLPSVEQLSMIKSTYKRELKNMTKDRKGFGEWFYLPSEIYKDVGFVKNWFNSVQQSHAVKKGNDSQSKIMMQNIYDALKAAAIDKGFMENFDKPGTIKGAFQSNIHKRIAQHYMEYRKLLKESKSRAYEYYKNTIEKFLTEGEGVVLKEFHELVTMSPNQYKRAVKGKQYGYLAKAAIEWKKLDKFAMDLNLAGLKNYYNALRYNHSVLKNYDGYNTVLRQIDSMYKQLKKHRDQGSAYFPVLTFDILPTLAEVSGNLFNSGQKSGKSWKEGVDAVNKLQDILDKNVYVSRNLKDGSIESKEIEYNVIPIMDNYIKTATRFNYVSYNNAKYIQATKNLWKSFSSDSKNSPTALDKKLEFYESYMSDTHGLITGEAYRGSEAQRNFARALTSYQFLSKLGLNVRSAARNSSQSLLNYVYFGGKGISDYYQWKGNPDNKVRVEQGLANNGTLFGEIREIYMDGLQQNVKNADGTYSQKFDLTFGDKIAEGLNIAAEKSGFMMQWVENKINRRYTFELGYSEKWKADDRIEPQLRQRFEKKLARDLKNEGKGETVEQLKQETDSLFEKNDSTRFEVKFEQYRRQRAERMGEKAVNMLHFDYSPLAKPKALITPLGSVLGQFQFYGLSFFNLQKNIATKGKDAMLAGAWNHPQAFRMYRLGFLYAGVVGLVSALTNSDVGNLVQNDTIERINQIRNYSFGDDEQSERAYFGKGPIAGNLGPTVADMVNLGNLSLLYNLDEEGYAALVLGYEDHRDKSPSERLELLVRGLNTQAGRTIYDTIPKLRKGVNPFILLQSELGLWSNNEIKERRKWLGENVPVLGNFFLDEDIVRNKLLSDPKPRSLTRQEFQKQNLQRFQVALGLRDEVEPVKDPFGQDEAVIESLRRLSETEVNF
tara:strand:+ start:15349 stop:18195 length:2847 start_codon:yes stop_codon:yes gene_type:complete